MKIDIHRHTPSTGTANIEIRNLFHNQIADMDTSGLYTLGLHPWHVDKATLTADLEKITETAHNKQIIAIGEAGLDKTIKTPFDIQFEAFNAQVLIAATANKPIIVHCVKAYSEVLGLKIRSGHKHPWIIHWFNAGEQIAEQLISKNFYLSFGHMLFNEQSKAYRAFKYIPVDKIFFETDDASYSIDQIYQRAASLLDISIESLEQNIEDNFEKCFGIKL